MRVPETHHTTTPSFRGANQAGLGLRATAQSFPDDSLTWAGGLTHP